MNKYYKCLFIVLALFVVAEVGLVAYNAFGGGNVIHPNDVAGKDSTATDTLGLADAPMLSDQARAYFNDKANSAEWSRAKLEELGLAELYDDLNNYNYDAITGRWARTLRELGHQDIVNAASTHAPGLKAPFTYNGSINLANYVSKLGGK